MTQQPMTEAQGNDRSEFADIISEVVTKMSVPAIVLNVTSMVAVRSDAHIGNWSHPVATFDCSHWCLPGVPDAWNELLFSYLLTDGEVSFSLPSIKLKWDIISFNILVTGSPWSA